MTPQRLAKLEGRLIALLTLVSQASLEAESRMKNVERMEKIFAGDLTPSRVKVINKWKMEAEGFDYIRALVLQEHLRIVEDRLTNP